MYMDEKMDEGDIISSKELLIGDNDTLDSLSDKMSILGGDLLLDTLPSIINHTNNKIKQNEQEVTYGYNIKKEEEKIDFSKSAIEIRNLVRALNSEPGAYCLLDNKRLKIYEVIILDKKSNTLPGKIIDIEKNGLIVTTKDYLIKIIDIKLEGKKRCLVNEFLNGIKKDNLIDKVLE